MNIFIVTLGSRGDVQPYVALGKGLVAAGHRVTICTSHKFKSFIKEHGLDYGYMGNELLELVETEDGRDAMEAADGVVGWVKTAIKLTKAVKPIQRQMLIETWAAAQTAAPDIVLYHPKAFGGISVAEKLGVPVAMAVPLPILVPTAETPNIVFPTWPLGGWYNKMTYQIALKGARQQYGKLLQEFREKVLGLARQPKSADELHKTNGDPVPVLHSYSGHVSPRPADWPAHSHATGYWFLEAQDEWTPSAELQTFLDAGDPPVYVGFGSMAGRDPQRLSNIVIDGLVQSGKRGIIATGWGGLDVDTLPDTIFKIDQAPHDWLFPRMAAVVHHGGAGTTAAGLRAGRPTLVCSFMADQPFWGRRVAELGVGVAAIPQKKLSAEKLSTAIRALTTDKNIQQRAEQLGAQLRSEDGVANAVAIIEKLVASES